MPYALSYAAADKLDFSVPQALTVVAVCALTALVSNMALAVFNDGVRPFLLDFIRGNTNRGEMTAVSFGLSAGFVFGLGAPMALSTGVLNPWLLFLPTDILGLFAPRRWLAPILGGAWGALVVFGLSGANNAAHDLPVDFLTAMQEMATPILFMFLLFPVIAIATQFGRVHGIACFVVEIAIVVLSMNVWPDQFPGALAMAAGVLMLLGFSLAKDVRERRTARAAGAAEKADAPGAATIPADGKPAGDPVASLFGANAERLRRHLPWFALLGAALAAMVNLHIFGGGEATSFLVAKGDYGEAAQVDFYRAFGFLPLIATTALASGAYQIVGFTFIYPLAYLAPNVAVAAVGGAVLLTLEILALSYIGKGLAMLPSIRDASDHLRNAIGKTLEIAILFGAIAAAAKMGGGLGIALVGGLYLLNESLGRPIVRLAAGPAAVVVAGIALNVLHWLDLFTPLKG
ncbi:YhfT family protein [Actinomadura madurae]|uniref:YhfT family protein n=1 Tax=Actinomadura madurae TaxID=1993 RepID=UPI0020268B1A|nr:YhfT family protein [Actinomadura madurae]MCP9955270.1 YhfT family protein [Actinomadura madurae]URN00740.1 YhfT family protein [Actinomadura madurae]